MNVIQKALLTAALFMSLGGCVILPHPVSETVEKFAEPELDERIVVSAGPIKMIKKVSKHIAKRDDEIEIVDAVGFRDAVFPNGDWRLAKLLDGDASAHRSTDGVRYVVLIGAEPMTQYGEDKGGYVPALAGVMYSSQTSRLTALVLDIESGQVITTMSAEAQGTPVMVTWIVVSAIKHPLTDSAVLGGLSEAIVAEIRDHAGNGPLRIAVLAAEGSADPFGIGVPENAAD